MRKILCVLLIFVIACAAAGCGGNGGESGGQSSGTADKDAIALLNTCEKTVFNVSATDALGRSFSASNGSDGEKYVGLFYFLWSGQEPTKQTEIYDNSKLIPLLGDDFWDGTQIFDSMPNQYHYWGEPLFGYYNSSDPWVMRRHMEMLTMAGVDFLVFDTTNQFVYSQVWSVLFPIMEEFLSQGFPVPKFAFYTNTDSPVRVRELYNRLYAGGEYADLWFSPNGKPLIIANNTAALSAEIRNFFDFRSSQWPGQSFKSDGFPWIDFSRDQHVYPKGGAKGGSIVSVSVSQHPGWPFSDSVQYKNVSAGAGLTYYDTNWGRGYTTAAGANDPSKVSEGANFAEQWNNAIEKAPSTVFVTGWNEWIAVKFFEDITITTGVTTRPNIPDRRVFFVDTVNEEFSRDIEPMKGGYGDNYYLQLISNIRAYKGLGGDKEKGDKLTVDINGPVEQWNAVTSSFRDFVGDAVPREFRNSAGTYVYTDNSNRNDISEIRLAHDDDNLYVLVSAAADITAYTEGDRGWMNRFLGVEGSGQSAFCDYNFVINRYPQSGVTSVERSLGGYAFENVGSARYSVSGKYIQFAVPKNLIGLSGEFTLKIKVADNITDSGDILDYYVSGDSAPIGRLSYEWRA